MNLTELKTQWEAKLSNAKNEKERAIARKRLDKISQQKIADEMARHGKMSIEELNVKLNELNKEKEKVEKLLKRFDDSELKKEFVELNMEIESISQLIKPDEIVEFSSPYGEIYWNKDKKTISIAEMQFTEGELELIHRDFKTFDKMTNVELLLKKKFNVKYLGAFPITDEDKKTLPDFNEIRRRRYAEL
jgi:hypothetical protein